MKASEFAKTHSADHDWVGLMDAQGLDVPVLMPGRKGMYGDFRATVQGHYHNGMYNVQLPGGLVCIAGADFIPDPKLPRSQVIADIDAKLLALGYRMEPSLGALDGFGHSIIDINTDEMPEDYPEAEVLKLAFQWDALNDALFDSNEELKEAAEFIANIDMDA